MGILFSCFKEPKRSSREIEVFRPKSIQSNNGRTSTQSNNGRTSTQSNNGRTSTQSINSRTSTQLNNGRTSTQSNNGHTLTQSHELHSGKNALVNTLFKIIDWPNKKFNDQSVYMLETLDNKSMDYQNLHNMFYKKPKSSCYNIKLIQRIHNPYLILQYTLKKMELVQRGFRIEEKIMFHGTDFCNIDNIFKNNFNWRLHGTSLGCKFGQGISFSPCAYYATHYGKSGDLGIMIVAIVLVGKCCEGDYNMYIPTPGCDTTTNNKKSVYVKYDDNTFYPQYVIRYSGYDTQSKRLRL